MNFQEDHYRNVIHQKDEEIRSAKIENIILNQFINNHFTHGPHPPHQILNANASFDLHAPPSSYPPYVAYGRPSGPFWSISSLYCLWSFWSTYSLYCL